MFPGFCCEQRFRERLPACLSGYTRTIPVGCKPSQGHTYAPLQPVLQSADPLSVPPVGWEHSSCSLSLPSLGINSPLHLGHSGGCDGSTLWFSPMTNAAGHLHPSLLSTCVSFPMTSQLRCFLFICRSSLYIVDVNTLIGCVRVPSPAQLLAFPES